MEDQQKELVEKITDGIAGMHVEIKIRRSDSVKLVAIVAVGAALGTGAYLAGRQLLYTAKRKLKERKEQKEWSK